MKFLSTHRLSGAGHIKTSSRMRVWWLAYVRGYKVENVLQHPYRMVGGRLRMTRTWVLRPPRTP